jgi:hypothetical protein
MLFNYTFSPLVSALSLDTLFTCFKISYDFLKAHFEARCAEDTVSPCYLHTDVYTAAYCVILALLAYLF